MIKRNDKIRLRRALTLVEMVCAMVMITIIFTAVLPQFSLMLHSWDSKQGAAEAIQNGRVLMDHINRNLSNAKRITAVSASTVTSGYIQFVDFNDFNDRYDVAASDSYVEYGVVGSLSDLAGPVNSFKFTCYDANITLLSPVTDTNLIRLVKVDATVTNSASNGKNKTYTTWAYLRTGANASPTISITQPTDGNSSFTAPASITISATASDSDGTVSKVDFYQGATLLGTDTVAPYTYAWSSVAAGSYSLTAKATDNDGAATTSSTVNITVKSGANLKAQYRCQMTASPTQQVQPYIEVFNLGATTIALTDITVRYWFTSEPATGSDTYICDYAAVGTATITGAFAGTSTHHYLQVGFTSSAKVGANPVNTLPASANTGEIQNRFYNSLYNNYTQTNDYSFDATKTVYTDWTNVTVYYKGTLVWGTEPP